jgi:tetratricopeptide (TPR) repeat protein
VKLIAAFAACVIAVASPALAAPDARADLAMVRTDLDQGRYGPALARAQAVLAAAEAGKDQLLIAEAAALVGDAHIRMGDLAAAETPLRRALALREKALGPDDRLTLASVSDLSGWLVFQGRDAEAEPLLARAADKLDAMARTPEEKADAAEARGGRAMALFNLGRWDEGEAQMKLALAALASPDIKPRDTLMAFQTVLSDAYFRWGRYDESAAIAEQALKLREEREGPEHPMIAGVLDSLAKTRLTQGDQATAERLYRRELAIAEKSYPDGGAMLAQAVQNLALFYSVTGRNDDALPLFERAGQILDKAGDHSWRAAELANEQALAYVRAGMGPEALAAGERSLALYEKELGPKSVEAGLAHLALARVEYALRHNDKGEAHAKAGYDIYLATLKSGNPRLGDALFLMGFGAQRRRNIDEAQALYARAVEAMVKARPPWHEALINSRTSLAQQIHLGGKNPQGAYDAARASADSLRGRILANARLIGGGGAPVMNESDRNVFYVAVRTGWALSEAEK